MQKADLERDNVVRLHRLHLHIALDFNKNGRLQFAEIGRAEHHWKDGVEELIIDLKISHLKGVVDRTRVRNVVEVDVLKRDEEQLLWYVVNQ